MAHDGIGQEDHAPDNVVLLLECRALEDVCATGALYKRFGYVLDGFYGMIQIVDNFIQVHGRHHPVPDHLRLGVQYSKCSTTSHLCVL